MGTEQQLGAQLTDRQKALLRDLRSWATFQPLISSIEDEDELYWLIAAERQTQSRRRVIYRIHSRLSVVRKNRELADIGSGAWPFRGINENRIRL